MAITFTLVHDHGYVLAVVVLYFLVNFFLGNLVNRARGKYKIPLPNLYANGAMFLKDGKVDENELKNRGDAFNKVQRGHQHLFESISDAHALLFTAAIQYPFHSACAGVAYAFGSLLYGIGYGIKPGLRLPGELIYLGGLGYQLYLTGLTAYNLLK